MSENHKTPSDYINDGNNSPVSFLFELSFGGKEASSKNYFQEASGINQEMNIEEVGSGGENQFKYRLPGVAKYNNLVLKRGLVSKNSALPSWVISTLNPGLVKPIETKDIKVTLLDSKQNIIISWDFINAYPIKWDVSNLNSMESEIAIETIEFAYNFFKKN